MPWLGRSEGEKQLNMTALQIGLLVLQALASLGVLGVLGYYLIRKGKPQVSPITKEAFLSALDSGCRSKDDMDKILASHGYSPDALGWNWCNYCCGYRPKDSHTHVQESRKPHA